MLCEACRAIDPRQLIQPPSFAPTSRSNCTARLFCRHPKSLVELEAAAATEECHLCYLITKVIEQGYDEIDDWELIEAAEDDTSDADERLLANLRSPCYDSLDCAQSDAENGLDSGVWLEFVFGRLTQDQIRSRSVDLILYWWGPEKNESGRLTLVSYLPDRLADFAVQRKVFEENGTCSAYASQLTRYWYENCRDNHPLCRESRMLRGSGLPTRVLDINPDNLAIDCCLHISVGESVPYACLSHCWGKVEVIKTEKSSLEERKKGIRLDDMPQTFRDAIAITRNLGLRYLWIDSLCIVQDDELDWETESANMDQVYMNASVTIAAVESDGDTSGCFKPFPAAVSGLCRTPMFDHLLSQVLGTPHSHTFVQQKLRHVRGTIWSIRADELQRIGRLSPIYYHSLNPRHASPLHKRAWTLQENVLSIGLLSYEMTEVRWSCATTLACECIPEGFDDKEQFSTDNQSSKEPSTTELREQDAQLTSFTYYQWSSLLGIYTGRAMTYENDRLPALAGLAKEMARVVKSDYLAGLWRNNLQVDLAWFRHPEGSPWDGDKELSSGYRAPSWSWASVNGAVRFRNRPTRIRKGPLLVLEAKIINCTVQHSGHNEFGTVTGGTLILRGLLKHARVANKRKQPVNLPSIRTASSFEGRLSVFDPSTLEEVGGFEPDQASWVGSEVWCMPILAEDEEWDSLSCLALTPTGSDGDVREFRRVGIIWMYHAAIKLYSDGRYIRALAWFENTPITTIAII